MFAKASFALLPLALANAVSAVPLAARAGEVQCKTTISNQSLFWYNSDNLSDNYNALSATNSVNGKYSFEKASDETSQRYGQEFKFNFQSCTSSYMGYKDNSGSGAEHNFGHVVVASAPSADASGYSNAADADVVGKCLTVRANPYPTQIGASEFNFTDCSQADDDSQLTQFFEMSWEKYSSDSKPNARGYVEFIGVNEANNGKYGNSAPPVYHYELKQDTYPAVQKLQRSTSEGVTPSIYFDFAGINGATN